MSTIEEELTEKTEQLNRRAQAIRKQRAKLRQRQRKARAEHLHELGEILESAAGRPLRAQDAEIAALPLSIGDGKLTPGQIAGALLGVLNMLSKGDPSTIERLHQLEASGAAFLSARHDKKDN